MIPFISYGHARHPPQLSFDINSYIVMVDSSTVNSFLAHEESK